MLISVWHFMFAQLSKPSYRVFVLTICYYASLYFSTSNRTILLFTLCYWVSVYRVTRNVFHSVLIVFVATLPFPKGKAYQILLLPKDLINRYALYNIVYFFPIYLSDFFLTLLGYLYVRNSLLRGIKRAWSRGVHIYAYIALSLFVVWVLIGGALSIFSDVGILSAVQLLRMFIIFGIPLLVGPQEFKRTRIHIFSVVIALLIFESGWTLLQRFHGGPLGKDIEVYLAGTRRGIFSSEDSMLLRNTGTFFEPSILGTFLLMQIGVLFSFLWENQYHGFRKLSFIAILLGSLALIFTGSRALYGVWLMMVIVTASLWYKTNPKGAERFFKYFSWKIIIGIGGLFFVIFPYLLQRLSSLTDVFTPYGSASYRIQMIVYAVRLASANLITGVGINLSPYYLATGFSGERFVFDPTYPHNLIAQLLAETGVIGTALFLFFIFLLLRMVRRSYQKGVYLGFGVAALIYVLCAQFYPIFLNHTELSSFFFLYAGFAVFWSQSRHYG